MSNVKLFESKQIRSVWNEADGKWYFSVPMGRGVGQLGQCAGLHQENVEA